MRLLYHKSDLDGFTDSAGTVIASDTQVLGRVSFGPKIGTTIQRGGTAIRPYAKINGIRDFEREDTATLTSGVVLKTGETAINLGGGVYVTYASGLAVRIAGDWFAYDTDFEGWSISGGLGGPLAAFGLGAIAPAALVSLGLTGSRQGASATARIRIPLN